MVKQVISLSWAFLAAVQFSDLLKTEAAWFNPCWEWWDHNRYAHTVSSLLNLLDPSVPEWWCKIWKSHSQRTHPLSPSTLHRNVVHCQLAFLSCSLYSCRRLGSELLFLLLMCCQADFKGLEPTEGEDYASVLTLMRPEQALWGFWVRSIVSVCNVLSTDLQSWMNSSPVNLTSGLNHFNVSITSVALWVSCMSTSPPRSPHPYFLYYYNCTLY